MPIAQRVRKEDLHGGLLFLRHPQNDPRVYFNYSTSVFYIQPFYCHPLETKKDSHFRASPYAKPFYAVPLSVFMELISSILIFTNFLCIGEKSSPSINSESLNTINQFSVSFASLRAISNFEIISALLCG